MQDHWNTCKKTLLGRLLAFSTYDTRMERAGGGRAPAQELRASTSFAWQNPMRLDARSC